jgi:hypothetical protein
VAIDSNITKPATAPASSAGSRRKSVLRKFNWRILNIAERNDIRKKMKREALRICLSILID